MLTFGIVGTTIWKLMRHVGVQHQHVCGTFFVLMCNLCMAFQLTASSRTQQYLIFFFVKTIFKWNQQDNITVNSTSTSFQSALTSDQFTSNSFSLSSKCQIWILRRAHTQSQTHIVYKLKHVTDIVKTVCQCLVYDCRRTTRLKKRGKMHYDNTF